MNKFHPNQLFPNNILLIPENLIQQDQFLNPNIIQPISSISEEDSHDEMLSNMALDYINQMLMAEENTYNYNDYSALEATQNSFYEILKENYRHPDSNHSSESPDSASSNYTYSTSSGVSSSTSSYSIDFSDPATPFSEMFPSWQDSKGVEESTDLLPSDEIERKESLFITSHGRKNRHMDSYTEEQKSTKQPSLYHDENARTPIFDDLLLSHRDSIPKAIIEIREALTNISLKTSKKKQTTKDFIDLHSLLIHCSQNISSNDQRNIYETLKQIRQHSSPTGDGTQRLTHYFADAIEARLSGTGNEIYESYNTKKRTAQDFLKAYGLYIAASPFKKVSYFFSNHTILNASKNAGIVHIVDFGINFGFQWPSFLQRISRMPGGPLKVRITGIDFPQPGFRPEEWIQETGRRLTDYARSFNVPFEYKPIASKWEDVKIEEIGIRKGEVLVVNCLFLARFLADESLVVESPRKKFLNVVRKMKPDVFIHGIENGAYGSPFFVTRFREALYHFSALYDMLESTVGRENEERKLIERDVFGRTVMNVIACEGLERKERPETYKQWQVRMVRAGFVKNAVDVEMMRKAKEKGRRGYHKDFDVDECDGWMLQGWKGRIVYALSSWRPDKK